MTESAHQRERLRRSVVLTFPLAFAVNDLEELLAGPRWSEGAAARLRLHHPVLARILERVLPVSMTEMTIAVGLVAAAVGGVTAVSVRDNRGDLRPLQLALAAYSAHSVNHIGASVLFRGYTPGVVTVPLVVVPYSLWAWPRLRRAGVVTGRGEVVRTALAGVALALPFAFVGHAVARAVVRDWRGDVTRHP